MTAKVETNVGQNVMVAEFTWSVGDTMTNTSGAADAFATVASHVFDVIKLPVGAVVIGGDLITNVAATGSTAYNVSVGDSGSATRYLGATDKTTAARTALVPTGREGTGESIRITVAPTVAEATAGTFTLRVMFVIDGRANEVL